MNPNCLAFQLCAQIWLAFVAVMIGVPVEVASSLANGSLCRFILLQLWFKQAVAAGGARLFHHLLQFSLHYHAEFAVFS